MQATKNDNQSEQCLSEHLSHHRLGRLRLDLDFLAKHASNAALGGRLLAGLDHEKARKDKLARLLHLPFSLARSGHQTYMPENPSP